ncbi:Cysteine--tRNA ligase OS=Stutzerimonas stutzeri OX=316 GN=cysS PE=3 SV=1 [Stutzerimonas stutzeri]
MSKPIVEKAANFLRPIVQADLEAGKHAKIITRFPPEPNGYLHIGHAKSICLNFGLAEEFGGQCNLRFDDTNPAKEDQEYIDAIKADVEWLGFKWAGEEHYASDYFDQLHEWAIYLIQAGKAFVCDLNAEEMRAYRGSLTEPGKNSPFRERIEVDEAKEDPLDFVLWKGAKPSEPSWESPWGPGRPGWHIECSVMSTCCLGETFDIHGGGPDLVFPHHENEIAQSEAATGKLYANAWMHAGAVRVDGEKMSKSLGNFFTIREVLEKYHPEVVRYLLVSSHYRSPINYSEDSLREAKGALERFYNGFKGLPAAAPTGGEEFVARFGAAMDDDFNSPEACAVLFEMIREVNRLRESDLNAAAALAARLKELAGVLGVLQLEPDAFLQAGAAGKVDASEVEALIAARLQARAEKNWAESDRIRDQLTAMGVLLEDGKGGTTWRLAE